MDDYLKCSRFMLKWHYVKRQRSKMSIFHALAIFRGTNKNDQMKIYKFGEEALEKYMKEMNRENRTFFGIDIYDLPLFEKIFSVPIKVFKLLDPLIGGTKECVFLENRFENPKMYLLQINRYKYAYIYDINAFENCFQCEICNNFFVTIKNLHRHSKKCLEKNPKLIYPGGGWISKNHSSLFVELAKLGIFVPYNLRFCYYISVFDFEVFFSNENLPKNAENTKFQSKLVPASIAIASNVPNFEKPIFFINEHNLNSFLQCIFTYFCSLSNKNFSILKIKYKPIFKRINKLLYSFTDKYNVRIMGLRIPKP